MERLNTGKKRENHYLTEQHHLLFNMEEEGPHGMGLYGWNGVGKLIEVQGTWIRFNTVKFWRMELRKV